LQIQVLKEGWKALKKKEKCSCLANNSDKFKTFSIAQLKFIDSFAFLSSGLGNILKSMPDAAKTRLRAMCANDKQFEYVKGKQFFPYEWFDCYEKLEQPLPTNIRDWYSQLSMTGLTEEDLGYVRRVCDEFELRTFRDWHEFYLKIDVYGLADAFEHFRTFSLREWELDPVGYLGLPGLSWDGLKLQWKKSGGEAIELLTDADMYRFFESGIRGGNSHVGKRHNKCNHPEVPGYDESKPICIDLDLDANNLYGHSMIQHLPHSKFDWCFDQAKLKQIISRPESY